MKQPIAASLLIGALWFQQAHAAALELQTPGTEFESTPYTLGFEFMVTSSIQVTSLGVYDSGRDGLEAVGAVALWRVSGGDPLARAVVPVGTGGTLDGFFRYTAITPLVLLPGEHYVVGAFVDGGIATSMALGQGGTGNVDPHITGLADRYSTEFALAFPATSDGGAGAWLGANFQLAPVSEPSPAVMLAAALAVAAIIWRRRLRA